MPVNNSRSWPVFGTKVLWAVNIAWSQNIQSHFVSTNFVLLIPHLFCILFLSPQMLVLPSFVLYAALITASWNPQEGRCSQLKYVPSLYLQWAFEMHSQIAPYLPGYPIILVLTKLLKVLLIQKRFWVLIQDISTTCYCKKYPVAYTEGLAPNKRHPL